jgi:hypothetical protein
MKKVAVFGLVLCASVTQACLKEHSALGRVQIEEYLSSRLILLDYSPPWTLR